MNTTLHKNRPEGHVKSDKFVFGTPWLLDLLCKHRFASSVWNFCPWVADVIPPRETSPAAKSEEKRMFSQATDCLTGWFPDMYLNVNQIEKRRKHSSPGLSIKWNYPLPFHKVSTVWVDLLPGKITQWLFLQRKVQLSPVHLFPVTPKIKREGNKLRFKVCHSPSVARGHFHYDIILLQLPQSIPFQWGLKNNLHEETKPGSFKFKWRKRANDVISDPLWRNPALSVH